MAGLLAVVFLTLAVGFTVSTVFFLEARAQYRALVDALTGYKHHTYQTGELLMDEPGMDDLQRTLLEQERAFFQGFLHQRRARTASCKGRWPGRNYGLGLIVDRLEHKGLDPVEKAKAKFAGLIARDRGDRESLAGMATCCQYLGRMYHDRDRSQNDPAANFGQRAEDEFKTAREIWEDLARDNQARHREGKAITLLWLGNRRQDTLSPQESLALYTDSLDLWNGLVEEEPENPSYTLAEGEPTIIKRGEGVRDSAGLSNRQGRFL